MPTLKSYCVERVNWARKKRKGAVYRISARQYVMQKEKERAKEKRKRVCKRKEGEGKK